MATILIALLALSPQPSFCAQPQGPEHPPIPGAVVAEGNAQEGAQDQEGEEDESKLNEGLLGAFQFRSLGPAFMSGRIADLAVDPEAPNTWYVAAGSGNLWKTTNSGTTFKPIFENYGSYSIGCVTIDPNQHNTIWVGTGEAVGGRHVGFGDGIYRSDDGGKSFRNLGLKETERIAKIVVDPRDSNVIYVAAQGPLWSGGGERGLYKSVDGGASWSLMLSAGEYTGVTDIVMDPRDSQVLYAATHQRMRTVWALINGGPESGIHKSVDGGVTWKELRKGLPGGDKGKIGLALEPGQEDTVYATIELAGPSGGFWRSQDAGASWSKQSDYVSGGTGPHYYQELWADPHHANTLYQANVNLGRTEDGGSNWKSVGNRNKHVDNHAVAFHPTDPEFLLVGCDGGLYISHDRGKTYRFCSNLALTQFYKLDVDNDWPVYNIVGGTQDNSTQYGPSRTLNRQGVRNSDWRIILGGDGHDNAIDPSDPNVIYGESQKGYIRRFNRLTGESVDVRPQPGVGEDNFRFNWDSPIFISPHNSSRVYFGSNYLHRSDDRGDSWTTVSPDLSHQRDRLNLQIMDRFWDLGAMWDLRAMSMYGNITSITESPLVEGLLYIGTDDGRIHVSEDGGGHWRAVEKIADVPDTAFINDVKADLFDANTVYAALDNHKVGDFAPYLVKSTDRGLTWTSIASDLPERHLVWRLVQDHEQAQLMFLGTEFGIFTTLDGGEHWMQMKGGMPKIPFRDLAIQKRENDLVGASFGRSFYVLDNYAPLRELSEAMLEKEVHIFAVRDALVFPVSNELGGRNGSQGDSHYSADNPDNGAVIRYYLLDGLQSLEGKRKEADREERKAAKKAAKEAAKAEEGAASESESSEGDKYQDPGKPYPGWDTLRAEKREEKPSLIMEIRDDSGMLVRRMNVPSGKGMQRVVWNMRFAGSGSGGGGRGPLVSAGIYQLQLYRLAGGTAQAFGEPQNVNVVDLFEPGMSVADRATTLAWKHEVGKLQNVIGGSSRVLSDALEDVKQMKDAVRNGRIGTLAQGDRLRTLELAMMDARNALSGEGLREGYHHEGAPSIQGRLWNALSGAFGTTEPPTATMREQARIAEAEFAKVYHDLVRLIENELPALQKELDATGVGWTSGRSLPKLVR
jgi:photosystem II stability/assembly factor-like uncharacterized protein